MNKITNFESDICNFPVLYIENEPKKDIKCIFQRLLYNFHVHFYQFMGFISLQNPPSFHYFIVVLNSDSGQTPSLL